MSREPQWRDIPAWTLNPFGRFLASFFNFLLKRRRHRQTLQPTPPRRNRMRSSKNRRLDYAFCNTPTDQLSIYRLERMREEQGHFPTVPRSVGGTGLLRTISIRASGLP